MAIAASFENSVRTRMLLAALVIAVLLPCAGWAAKPPVTERVSAVAGGEPNGASFFGYISADGRYVTYESSADNLVSGDFNHHYDVFRYDTKTRKTVRVSVSSAGVEGDDDSSSQAISGNGRYVLFSSKSKTLVADDTNGVSDAFVYDAKRRVTSRVSLGSAGQQAGDVSYGNAISRDGRFVLFNSYDNALVDNDGNGLMDVFLRDRKKNTTTLISAERPGRPTDGCYAASQSLSEGDQARYVLFICFDRDDNSHSSVFRLDRRTGATVLVSVDSSGAQAAGNHNRALMSDNGRYVVFYSDAALVSEDTNGQFDIYLRDIKKGTTKLLVRGVSGTLLDQGALVRSISANARYVAFVSTASNVTAVSPGGKAQVYRYDAKTRVSQLLSTALDGSAGNGDSNWPILSADGSSASFDSEANNLISGDSSLGLDVFIRRFAKSRR